MKKVMMVFAILFSFGELSLSQVEFEKITLDEALEKAKKSNKRVFVDIYAEWCGPCQMLSANVFPDKSLGEFLNPSFINVKVDGDKEINQSVMIDYGITAYPTLLFIDPKGKTTRKIEGYAEIEEIIQEAKFSINPELTPVFQAKAALDNQPSRLNHRALIQAMLDDNEMNDDKLDQSTNDFLNNYPLLELSNEAELYVFLAKVTHFEDENMQNFISTLDDYDDQIAQLKFIQLVRIATQEAIEAQDLDQALANIDQLYPIFEEKLDEELTKELITEFVEESFKE
jgi:thioredoxin-related protein